MRVYPMFRSNANSEMTDAYEVVCCTVAALVPCRPVGLDRRVCLQVFGIQHQEQAVCFLDCVTYSYPYYPPC